METSPSISEKFIKLFKDTYSSNKEEKQAIFNNLNKPEVCGFIESTANSLYKAPIDNYLSSNNFPYEKNQKIGFGCGFNGRFFRKAIASVCLVIAGTPYSEVSLKLAPSANVSGAT